MIVQLDSSLWLIVQVARVGGFRALVVLDRVRLGSRDAGMIWRSLVFADSQSAAIASYDFLRRHAAVLGIDAAAVGRHFRSVTPEVSPMGGTNRVFFAQSGGAR